MMIRAIVAYDQNRAIGRNNELFWGKGEMKNDMRRFREKTLGHAVIMGRKTFESMGQPLPKRRNIIMSRTLGSAAGAEVVTTFEQALELCEGDDYVDVIGGEQIYKESLPFLNIVHATEVAHQFENADAYFPQLTGEWSVTEDATYEADENNIYSYRFMTYERI